MQIKSITTTHVAVHAYKHISGQRLRKHYTCTCIIRIMHERFTCAVDTVNKNPCVDIPKNYIICIDFGFLNVFICRI